MIGAVGGAAFGAIGGALPGAGLAVSMERAGLEGFVGGALTEANGGRFSDGFLGAFAASAAGGQIDSRIMPHSESAGAIAARTAAAAALGGTASKINGGNFANGAWSAAFQHLFNDEMHREFQGMVRDVSGRTPSQLSQLADEGHAYESNPQWQASGSDPAMACNDIGCYNMDEYLKFWTADVPAISLTAVDGAGTLRFFGRGSIKAIKYSTVHSRDLGKACFLCGSLITNRPANLYGPAEVPRTYIVDPTMDVVNDIRRWSMRQWKILTRALPGGD